MEAGRAQGVDVGAATARDRARLVADRPQRPSGELDRRIARSQAVSLKEPLDRDVEIARGVIGRVLKRVDDGGHDLIDPLGVDRPHLGLDAAALGDHVGRGAARDHADVDGRLDVEPPVRHRRNCPGSGDDRAATGLGRHPCMGSPAVDRRDHAHMRRRGDDHLAERGGMVEDEAELAAERPDVERGRALQAGLLADREEQLDADLGRLGAGPAEVPRELDHRRDGRLVVRTEDPAIGVLPDPLPQHRLDRGGQRHRVHVRAEHHPAGAAARDPREQVAAVGADLWSGTVLFDLEPEARELAPDPVRTPTLPPGWTFDPAQRCERLIQAGADLGGERRGHGEVRYRETDVAGSEVWSSFPWPQGRESPPRS